MYQNQLKLYKIQILQIDMWKTLISTLLYAHVVISQANPEYNYEIFMGQFNRTYEGQQKQEHQKIFDKNYAVLLDKRNQGQDLEVNEFMDWNQTQREHFFNYKNNQFLRSSPLLSGPSPIQIPKQFDWRKKNVVSSVKHQKQCGGCYAFASAGLYEGLIARERGNLYNLSAQYALECDMRSAGCEGGYPSSSLQLYRKYGIPLQEQYPYRSDSSSYYTGLGKPICSATNKTIKLKGSVSSVVRHRKLSRQKVQQFLVRYGPLVVAVSTNNPSFMYAGSSGLINKCTPGKIDHAVLLVGYNITHWFIKNSWGAVWGHQGFGYIAKQNDCQLTAEVIFMQYDLSSKPNQLDQNISLQIYLKSKNSRGWGGNVVQFRQNNITVTKFGQGFLHGNTQGPFNISIYRNVQIQLIFVKGSGLNLNQIGFTVKDPDGMIILQQPIGTMDNNMKDDSFCPSFQCITMDQFISYTLHLSDASGDTWQGTVLAFSPAGSISSFTMDENGESKGPIRVLFPKNISEFSIVVRKKGQFSSQVGFTLENSQKQVVAKRSKMIPISVDRILGKVKNVDKKAPYASSIKEDDNYLQIQNDGPKKIKIDQSEDKNIEIRKLKLATMSLGILSGLLAIGFGIIVVKMYKVLRKQSQLKMQTNSKPSKNIQSTEQQKSSNSNHQNTYNNHENTITMLKGHTKIPTQKIPEITNNN